MFTECWWGGWKIFDDPKSAKSFAKELAKFETVKVVKENNKWAVKALFYADRGVVLKND